jgi:hypothetical protein
MRKIASFASNLRLNAISCCCAVALLSACGAGVSDPNRPQSQTAGDIIGSVGQPAAVTGPGTADQATAQVSGAVIDAGTEPAPEQSASQPEPAAEAAAQAPDTAPAPAPLPPVGATTSSPAIIYSN